VSASIPLAVLFAIAVSSALGETINVMSLGGLALAVGMLVDDATVEIENTHRNLGLEQKKPLASAILDSAEQVAVPALISTMSICIVFVPVILLSGSAKFIFTPLALNVVLALVASYGLSRTLVPTMMHFLLPKEAPLYQGQEAESPLSRSFIWRFHFVQSFYSGRSSPVPFSHPNAYALIAQPLLRGAGHANNTRYIAIAQANKRISAAVLEQQMISTIAGVRNLYVDLVSLQDSVKVQQQALSAAELLLNNDRQQLDVGRLAPIEVARAESLVTSTWLMLTQVVALRDQQEVILRTLLDPQSLRNADGNVVEIVAIDPLVPPQAETAASLTELVKRAWETRPDVRQARLQVTNGERQVASAANAAKPEVDVYGTYESRGVVIPGLTAIGGDPLTGNALIDPVPTGGTRSSTVYEAGIQFFLPVQNRVAKANLGADKALLQQQQLRVTQLESQVAAEVRNAITALNAAKSAADAATTARELQARLLAAAQESFSSGYTTNISVIEQQTYLVQAQTTEVVAKAAWLKASAQLDRVLGRTLEKSGISLKRDQPTVEAPQH
jgi:outer membrane protein TolC